MLINTDKVFLVAICLLALFYVHSFYLIGLSYHRNSGFSICFISVYSMLLLFRMFVDALDAQMYDKHHQTGHCILSLHKVIPLPHL